MAPGAMYALAGTVGRAFGRRNDGRSLGRVESMDFIALEALILLEFQVDRFS
jgi:hypothetical protein